MAPPAVHNCLGLPGRNQETYSWLQQLLQAVTPAAAVINVARYRHWTTAAPADVAFEARRLQRPQVDLVIAKSLGTMVMLHAHQRQQLTTRSAVFIGTPLQNYNPQQLSALPEFARNQTTLFIQQQQDFTAAAEDLAELVGQSPNIAVATVSGSDHNYANLRELIAIIKPWLHAQQPHNTTTGTSGSPTM